MLAAPVDFDTQDLAAREPTYEVEDFIARSDFTDVDEFDAREYLDEEIVEARDDDHEDVFARSVSTDYNNPYLLSLIFFDSLSAVEVVMDFVVDGAAQGHLCGVKIVVSRLGFRRLVLGFRNSLIQFPSTLVVVPDM